jgi:Terpene cyclase DEP1
LILCTFGLVLPYWQFVPWLAHHGLNLRLFFGQLFSNRVSAFFAIDLIVSAAVLIAFIICDNSGIGARKRLLPVVALLIVGVSLAFPLFLYLREGNRETA